MQRKRRLKGDQGICLSIPMLSLKNKLPCETQKITGLGKKNLLENLQWQMEFLLINMYHEKMCDKTQQSFSHIITQQKNNATMKEKSAHLWTDSHTLQEISQWPGIKKDPASYLLVTWLRTDYKQLDKSKSTPGESELGPRHDFLPLWGLSHLAPSCPSTSAPRLAPPLWSFICGSQSVELCLIQPKTEHLLRAQWWL